MPEKPLLDDILSLGRDLFGSFIDARHDIKTEVKQRVGSLTHKLDFVSREEFDAAFEMLAKARDMQEDLNARLSKIEERLSISKSKKSVKKASPSLRILKTKTVRRKRK